MNTALLRAKTMRLISALLLMALSVVAQEPLYPVKVSPNGRYFVDQQGNPVFWLGMTQWQLFREYSLEDAKLILQKSKERGFAFVQVMLLGVGDGTKPNVYGEKPLLNDDPLTPNEAYFKNVDAILQSAREQNINISMTLFHQRYRKAITLVKARAWAKWLAARYKNVPHLVWSMTPEAKPEFVPILRELAAGLRDGDGGSHLVTFKPDPAPYSSSFIHDERWLDFDSMKTWKSVELIYPMVTRDYQLKPVKPVLMAEGAYEHGSEYGFDVTPLWIRRQAYYSFLCGGHHTYGHNDSWRVLPTWKQALDAPGAVQLGILKRIFQERTEWWHLVPDQTIFASGSNPNGQVLNLAARHTDGRWLMAYLGSRASFSIDMTKVTGGGLARASWIDPRTGDAVPIGSFPSRGEQSFSTPAGWEDALLVVEPEVFDEAATRALAAMKTRAEELKVKGVAVVAYCEGENVTSWSSKMVVVGALKTAPSQKDAGANLLAIAYAKAAEMAETLKDSGHAGRPPMTGETGWQGGLIKKGKTGYLIAAFSGGPSEADLKVSQAGLEVLAEKL